MFMEDFFSGPELALLLVGLLIVVALPASLPLAVASARRRPSWPRRLAAGFAGWLLGTAVVALAWPVSHSIGDRIAVW